MHNISMETITPIKPATPYIGGKARLAARIITQINTTEHTTYAEPFVGMGGVFFRRGERPKSEVINDISGDVANFFRILQRHYVHFMEMLKFQLSSRCEFERLKHTNPETLTDLERAARFLYVQKIAFGGLVVGRCFGVSPTESSRFNITKLGPVLEDIHERLAGVTIEQLPYHDFIKRYDRQGTLFYLDPPYWGVEDYYGKNMFSQDDFGRLSDQLCTLKGRFILSLNDTPGVREVFECFTIEEVSTLYTANPNVKKKTIELLISGP